MNAEWRAGPGSFGKIIHQLIIGVLNPFYRNWRAPVVDFSGGQGGCDLDDNFARAALCKRGCVNKEQGK